MAQASNDSTLNEQFAALLSAEGWQLLSTIDPSMVSSKDAAWTLNEKLRKDGHAPEVVRAVIVSSPVFDGEFSTWNSSAHPRATQPVASC
ncbi:hypothetical protein [Glutamicibacter sp. AOP5-A2-18]|uniref:hypothetical protein n=1 Tax=Glutamicibacter sp. AOP5-A2-18 TaxID=3457656 RepID=UPI004034B063